MVAEELHFRKAASKLFISQPPLTRQIKELEKELGVRLFERNNKRVTLTPAGVFFKSEVDAMLARLKESKNIVKQIHENLSGEFKIGYISSTYHTYLINILKDMRLTFPFLSVKLYEVATVKQVKALEEGKLDVGIMRAPVNSDQLKVISLFHDPFIVTMPYSDTAYTSMDDLKKYLSTQSFIFFNRDYAPVYYQKLIEICNRLGFTPKISHEANNVHSILRLVEGGAGVSILPSSIREQYSFLKVNYHYLDELPINTEVVLSYKEQHRNGAVTWFAEKYAGFFEDSKTH